MPYDIHTDVKYGPLEVIEAWKLVYRDYPPHPGVIATAAEVARAANGIMSRTCSGCAGKTSRRRRGPSKSRAAPCSGSSAKGIASSGPSAQRERRRTDFRDQGDGGVRRISSSTPPTGGC